MSNKPPSPKFAEIIPTGPVAIICGIGAITTLFQNQVIACLIGIAGVAIGSATLRMVTEKLDKNLAIIGIILSCIPIIYAMVILVKK